MVIMVLNANGQELLGQRERVTVRERVRGILDSV